MQIHDRLQLVETETEAKFQADIRDLRDKLLIERHQHQAETKRMEDEIERLKGRLESEEKRAAMGETQKATEYQDEIRRLKDRALAAANHHEAEIRSLREQISSLQGKVQAQEAKEGRLKEEMESRVADVEKQRRSYKDLESEYHSLQAKHRELIAKEHAMQTLLSKLKSQV